MAQGNKNGLHGENGTTFEESFTRLQEVVQKLSDGNLTLQDALAAFEEGMELAERCTQMLDTAELRLKQISAESSRSAADALGELEAVMRQSPAMDEREEVLSVELESYETRLVFEVPADADSPDSSKANLAYSPLPGERGGKRQPPGEQAKSVNQTKFNPGDELELDPLFDEED
jgi:exodeoxyribonuclease VII small subunit